MKCASIVRGSHLKKWLGFAEKSLKSHDVNNDGLSNGAELANKRAMVLQIIESMFQIWSHFLEKMPDGAEKYKKW